MLTIVSTPIGDLKDITQRALETLKNADVIIGEEQREASTLLKKLQIPTKPLYLLNEHSTTDDLKELLMLCENQNVALISDCGTPSFYDPGFQLVQLCRSKKIPIKSAPGASSLMTLLSLVSKKITQFHFAGFLPADNEIRSIELKKLFKSSLPVVLMDTPYRLNKLLNELSPLTKERLILLGVNLTQVDELILEGTALEILNTLKQRELKKAEFILLIY